MWSGTRGMPLKPIFHFLGRIQMHRAAALRDNMLLKCWGCGKYSACFSVGQKGKDSERAREAQLVTWAGSCF